MKCIIHVPPSSLHLAHVLDVCVCECVICLALVLADIRTMPCMQKHAGMGLESRSGLENSVGRLLRPDFLLSLAVCCPSPEATARNHASCHRKAQRSERIGVCLSFKGLHSLLAPTEGLP